MNQKINAIETCIQVFYKENRFHLAVMDSVIQFKEDRHGEKKSQQVTENSLDQDWPNGIYFLINDL